MAPLILRHGPVKSFRPAVCIVSLGLIAYHNCFHVPFNFDDLDAINFNGTIRNLNDFVRVLQPPRDTTVAGRPMVNLSLAINYAISGLDVVGYHVMNVAIHIAAALALFGLLRRTLHSPRLSATYGSQATPMALVVACLWIVHPLCTMSVTYVIQRAEALMALSYLLTLYCSARGFVTAKPAGWYFLAVISCAFGMGCKESMITAPIAVLLYDRVFHSGTIKNAIQRRAGFYLGLMLTVGIPIGLTMSGPRSQSAGFALKDITVSRYLRAQPEIILYYLSLVFWPYPLCLDYDWPIATSAMKIVPASAAVLVILWLSIRAIRRGSPAGFASTFVFLVLSPTSSVVPIIILASEHRMYLPMAAVISLIVFFAYFMLGRFGGVQAPTPGESASRIAVAAMLRPSIHRAASMLGASLAIPGVAVLCSLTVQRNKTYQTNFSIWTDTVKQRPDNFRALNGLGYSLSQQSRFAEAIPLYRQAIKIFPGYVDAHFNLAEDLRRVGKKEEAAVEYDLVLKESPRDWQALAGRAALFIGQGKMVEAEKAYRDALALRPEFPPALSGLGLLCASQGKHDEAIGLYQRAVKSDPGNPQHLLGLGIIQAIKGNMREAVDSFEKAIRKQPGCTAARYRLALALSSLGELRTAMVHYRQVLEEEPKNLEARVNFSKALSRVGEIGSAVQELRGVLKSDSARVDAKAELAWILATTPDDKARNPNEAVILAQDACAATQNEDVVALDTLGAAYAAAGRFEEAIKLTEQALEMAQKTNKAEIANKISGRLQLYRKGRPFRSPAQ